MANNDELAEPSAEKQKSEGTAILMCTACGAASKKGEHFCEKCGAPISDYAYVDPVMGITSRGYALQKGSATPRKLVVVIGICFWMGLGACLLSFYSVVGWMMCLEGANAGDSGLMQMGAMVGLGSLVLAMLGIAILLKTVGNYIRQRKLTAGGAPPYHQGGNATDPKNDCDDDDHQCLACGKQMSASDDKCPDCGWSY